MSPDPTPASPSLASDLSRGTNQIGVRLYNERLILSLIRRHGSLPKAEIARLTGLSAQTISVIMRQLEADGLVLRQARQRGRVGQPSVPFALDPDGAFALGLKIGRRSSDLLLLDLLGQVRRERRLTHPYPTPEGVLDLVRSGVPELTAALTEPQAARIAGLGIASPFELWSWSEELGAPPDALDPWREFDTVAEVGALGPWPVQLCNDATAACAAELILGRGTPHADFLYVFIGSFIGGGVVLNGSLHPGRTGNAGAIGSMPIARRGAGHAGTDQLIRSASIWVLEQKLVAAGRDATVLWRSPDHWDDLGPVLEQWLDEAAESLALAITSSISVLDFSAVVIDGAFPVAVRAEFVTRVRARLETVERHGLSDVALVEGSVGANARAIGGACLPLIARFGRDQDVLLKENGGRASDPGS